MESGAAFWRPLPIAHRPVVIRSMPAERAADDAGFPSAEERDDGPSIQSTEHTGLTQVCFVYPSDKKSELSAADLFPLFAQVHNDNDFVSSSTVQVGCFGLFRGRLPCDRMLSCVRVQRARPSGPHSARLGHDSSD